MHIKLFNPQTFKKIGKANVNQKIYVKKGDFKTPITYFFAQLSYEKGHLVSI